MNRRRLVREALRLCIFTGTDPRRIMTVRTDEAPKSCSPAVGHNNTMTYTDRWAVSVDVHRITRGRADVRAVPVH